MTDAPQAVGQGLAVDARIEKAARAVGYDREKAEARVRSFANWFYWIAGLSGLNTLAVLTGMKFHFLFGLGFTQVVDAFAHHLAKELGVFVHVMEVGIDVSAVAFWVGLGLWAHRLRPTPFIVGSILYAVDAVIVFLFHDWFAVGFHLFALVTFRAGMYGLRVIEYLATSPRPAAQPAPPTLAT